MKGQAGWACVARLGGIGDNLIAASVLAPLKQLGYKVEVIAAEPTHVVFLHNPHIDKLSIKKGDRDIPQGDMDKWQQWFATRANEYDVFVNLSHSCEVLHALFPGSTPFYWPADYRRKLCAGSYLESVMDIAGVPHVFGPLYYASAEEKERAIETKKKIGERCVGWVLSGSRVDKVYPYATMAICRIIKEHNIPVVLFGAGSEREIAMGKILEQEVERTNSSLKGLHSAMSDAGSEAGGKNNWPIRRAFALLQQCDLVVTPDTGSAWAVAMEPMPKVAMVSHASAENITKNWVNTTTLHADPYRVPCWPCHRLHNTIDTCVPNKDRNAAACMTDIPVERVVSVVGEQLNGLDAVRSR